MAKVDCAAPLIPFALRAQVLLSATAGRRRVRVTRVLGVGEGVDERGEVGEARVLGKEVAFGGFELRDFGVEFRQAR